MKKILIYIHFCLIIFCVGCAPKSTAKLTPISEKLVNLYIGAGHVQYNHLIMLQGSSYGDHVSLTILNPIPEIPPAGLYNGVVYYNGVQIVLYGDSWNRFFWESFQDPVFVPNDADTLFYDPCEWCVSIFAKDTTIERWASYFSCTFPYPLDTLDNMLK